MDLIAQVLGPQNVLSHINSTLELQETDTITGILSHQNWNPKMTYRTSSCTSAAGDACVSSSVYGDRMTEFCHTSSIESVNSLLLKYANKSYVYRYIKGSSPKWSLTNPNHLVNRLYRLFGGGV